MKRINILELWETEWNNAHKFFNSKGNVKTKSGLKDKWYKDFKNMLMTLEKTITKNIKPQAPRKSQDENPNSKEVVENI